MKTVTVTMGVTGMEEAVCDGYLTLKTEFSLWFKEPVR